MQAWQHRGTSITRRQGAKNVKKTEIVLRQASLACIVRALAEEVVQLRTGTESTCVDEAHELCLACVHDGRLAG